MKKNKLLRITKAVALTVLVLALNGCMAMGRDNPLGLGKSWKEEVLLHDGNKIIVKRAHSYGGYPMIDSRSRVVRKEECWFTIPGTKQKVAWASEFGRELQDNLTLLALDIFDNTPYIVTNPAGCLAYNRWGRPNPPYLCFKYAGTTWQRIPLTELPAEMKEANVIIGGYDERWDRNRLWSPEPVSAEEIKKLNSTPHTQPEYKTILREPIMKPKSMECPEMVRAKDGWLGIDWFSDQPNYDACVKMCERQKVRPQNCPCDRLFNKSNTEK